MYYSISRNKKPKSLEDVMYFYYDVRIDKKDYNSGLYKQVCKRTTSDFPCIDELKFILEYQLNNEVNKNNSQRIEYKSGNIEYRYTIQSEGFGCDDFYELTRIDGNNCGRYTRYILYVGTTYDNNGDLNSVGIRNSYVDENDLRELLNCVNKFIKYALE